MKIKWPLDRFDIISIANNTRISWATGLPSQYFSLIDLFFICLTLIHTNPEHTMTLSTQIILDKLRALNITLPEVATPAAAYLPFVQTGKLVFISGHIAKKTARPGSASWGKT